ncbi:TonB-dependent receptor [Vibrio sp. SCSIO 43140]|uniref:TonB-dependent receptor n=1 Tax=Vibrio sp. SCSIO 43140 TaxID=2819100 RepID=UPI002074C755|nr:TonB-dependent receptor [Vibrio sp. SCSIO 43140]USD61492.1 TonB-dependent receptor [Vibrio sp. SCSIO 43140]
MTFNAKTPFKVISLATLFFSSCAAAIELPLFKKEAEERGYTLPEAVGLSLGYMNVSQGINVNSIALSGLPSIVKNLNIKTEGGYQESEVLTLKADVWVLPFLNFYAIGGKLNGYSETTIKSVSGTLDFGIFERDIEIDNINAPFRLDLDGYTYGAGTVIAGGYESFFALVDASYTKTSLTVIDGEIDSIVVSPRIGWDFSRNTDWPLRAWVGAQYQNIEQTLSGNVKDLPLGSLSDLPLLDDARFTVNQSLANNWNSLVGAQYEFTPNWVLISELGFGQRKSFFITLDARF